MDRCASVGMFAFSHATSRTRRITSESSPTSWSKGAFYGWYFGTCRSAVSPTQLIAQRRQRVRLHERVSTFRNTRPFWWPILGDGRSGGCLWWTQDISHQQQGDVETSSSPLARTTIKEKSLIECLSSDFFKDLRNNGPFGKTVSLSAHRPSCVMKSRERNGAYPTHDAPDDAQRDAAECTSMQSRCARRSRRLAETRGPTSGWRATPTTTSASREVPTPTCWLRKPVRGADKVGAARLTRVAVGLTGSREAGTARPLVSLASERCAQAQSSKSEPRTGEVPSWLSLSRPLVNTPGRSNRSRVGATAEHEPRMVPSRLAEHSQVGLPDAASAR